VHRIKVAEVQGTPMRKRGLVAIVLSGVAFASSSGAADPPSSEVRFVGCPADGQLGPLEPPNGKPLAVRVESPAARRLAYYQAAVGMGVLAPQGWHCRGWYGSSGYFLAVTPEEIPAPYFPLPRIAGPVVYLGGSDAETSGRFTVAVTAARLFPKSTRDFVERIKAEGIMPAKDFDVRPFPADQLHYLSGRALEFITPAGKDGLGTAGLLQASALPVRGLVALDSEARIEGEREVFVRVPAELAELAQPILEWEKPCFLDFPSCRGHPP
jgi:hypothetical protein